MILIPGFCDPHIHSWQGQIPRIVANQISVPPNPTHDYMTVMHETMAVGRASGEDEVGRALVDGVHRHADAEPRRIRHVGGGPEHRGGGLVGEEQLRARRIAVGLPSTSTVFATSLASISPGETPFTSEASLAEIGSPELVPGG